MLVKVDFGIESILVSACDMMYALRAAWYDMIYNYDEHQEQAVERFREELPNPLTEEALRAHTQSCRDFGYKWTELAIKGVTELTAEEYQQLRTEQNLRECRW